MLDGDPATGWGTSRLRLDLTSRHPGGADGAQRIVAFEAGDG
ncbi:hypothetical protein [Streptomyces malaysiensis]